MALCQSLECDYLNHLQDRTKSHFLDHYKSNIDNSESLRNGLDILNMEVKVVKQLALECGTRNKVYLLINIRSC